MIKYVHKCSKCEEEIGGRKMKIPPSPPVCFTCKQKVRAEYYQKNKGKFRERAREHYWKNREKIKEYMKEYHQKNKEKFKKVDNSS